MNIPINYAKWSAPTLPAGLKIKNGVISGIPSGDNGSLIVPVSVATPWGNDTKNITFHMRSTQKYVIYQNGEKLEDITLSELITSIQNGTAQEKYNCTNTQIMILIITPAMSFISANEEAVNRPSQFDIAAVNFCSFRNVTLADGTVKPGLILQFDKTLWRTYCCFDTGDIIRDPDSYGYWELGEDESVDENTITNRWRYCNLRQWLNSQGSNWFSPAYDTDVLLKYPDSVIKEYDLTYNFMPNMRNAEKGFLSCLPQDLVDALQPIKIQTQAFFNEDNFDESIEEPETINGVYVDTTYDKIFIPSLEEMNIKPSDNNSEAYNGSKKNYANDGIEGTAWEYYVNKFGTQSRYVEGGNVANDSSKFIFDLTRDFEEFSSEDLYRETINSSGAVLNVPRISYEGYMTRSAKLNDQQSIWFFNLDYDSDIYSTENDIRYAKIFTRIISDYTISDLENYYGQPAPAFALC